MYSDRPDPAAVLPPAPPAAGPLRRDAWRMLDRARLTLRLSLGLTLFGLALWGRFALVGLLPPTGFPFLTFFPAVLLTALLAGLGPALTVSALSVLAARYWFVPPVERFGGLGGPDAVALLVFGGVLLVDCLVIDLAKRSHARARLAEARLRDSEAGARRDADAAQAERRLLEATLDAVPAGIVLTDAQGRVRRMNEAGLHLGGPPQPGAQRPWTVWWADGGERDGRPVEPDDAVLARALRGERCQAVVEIEPAGNPGARRLMLLSAAPVRAADGRVDGAVMAQVDLSDRRRAEAALRRNEANFRTLADNLPQLAWMADPDGHPFWFNRRWREYTGLPDGALDDAPWRSVLAPQEADRVVTGYLDHVRRGEPWEDSFAMRRHDGCFRWFLSRARPLLDADGRVERWLGTNTDITEQREAEQALRASREQLLGREAALQQADRDKDAFLATLAHELRNPLAPIRAAAHVLRLAAGDAAAAETVQRMGGVVDRQSARLARLVDDLLDVSRLTLGRLRLTRRPVDLRQVVDSVLEAARPQIDAAGQQLALRLPDAPVVADVDEARIAQAMANLLDNACKFTPRGGHIELALAADAGEAVLTVRDDGRGIAPAMLEQVFELFRQEQRSGLGGNSGLGIGLALTRRLVVLHGGRIAAHSDGEGRGTTMRLALPLAEGPAAGDGRLALPAVRTRRHVLVVDDNPDQLDSLRALLELQGHEVATAADGREALEAVRRLRPSVVLLDIGLPDLDGHAVARAIRAMPELSPAPRLVALTGWGQAEDRQRALQAGFEQHLTKPADPVQLAAVLQNRRSTDPAA